MKNLSLDDIVLFLTFAEARNAIEAAARLGVSQPTLTERLRRLQAALPADPFSWQGRKKVLNPFGKYLYETLAPRVRELERAVNDVSRASTVSRDLVVRLSGRMEILMRAARETQFPGTLIFDPCTSKEAVEKVLRGESDIALTHVLPDRNDVTKLKLFKSEGALCIHRSLLPTGHVPGRVREDWGFLSASPCVAYRKNDPLLRSFLAWSGVDLEATNARVFCENWVVLKDLVEMGKGFAAMPMEVAHMMRGNRNVEVVAFPLGNDTPFAFYAVYRKELKSLDGADLMLRSLKTALEERPRE